MSNSFTRAIHRMHMLSLAAFIQIFREIRTIALMPLPEMWIFNRRSSGQLNIFWGKSRMLTIKSYNKFRIACSWHTNKGLNTEWVMNQFHWYLYGVTGIISYWSLFHSWTRIPTFLIWGSIQFNFSFLHAKRNNKCKVLTVNSSKM